MTKFEVYILTVYSINTHILTHQQHTAFEKIVGIEEIAGNKQFLLFPQCFLCNRTIVPHLSIFISAAAQNWHMR